MKTIIVWFRNDLRIHDNSALAQAVMDADRVVPLFIFDELLLHGSNSSANRNRFLIECLEDLKRSLGERGADLIVRRGVPAEVLSSHASEVGSSDVYCTQDYSPFATRRDELVAKTLRTQSVVLRQFPGRLLIDSPAQIRTKTGTIYRVFSPFWRTWQETPRREIVPSPHALRLPQGMDPGHLPRVEEFAAVQDLSPDVVRGGESAGRKRLEKFLADDISTYHLNNNDLAADKTSRLSPYLHFGCLSVREIEATLPAGDGPAAWHRQLCWRDFYYYILANFPDNARMEFQERYRLMEWGSDETLLAAWKSGRTGYPVVDAAMRQLLQEGWMHNRARLTVGSFLTKDLWQDWRHGEHHFMRMLLDGDQANNNGNWQWIASTGVDPAPVFRRLYNPVSQHERFDPTSAYVRRYVPELRSVPDEHIYRPWLMPESVQREVECVIGSDYPAPIVDHAIAREAALDRFRHLSKPSSEERPGRSSSMRI